MTLLMGCGPARSARKAKGHGHLRRGEILEAAERIFVRDGYAGATIRRIADEVGVSSTALYMHFRDKSEMLRAICEGVFADLLARNEAILAQPGDAATRVRDMLEAYIDFAIANPHAYALVFDPAAGEVMKQTDPNIGKVCFAVFERGVEALAEEGRLDVPPPVAAQALWAASHGLASLLTAKEALGWDDPPAVRRAMLDSLFAGMLKAA